MKFTLLLLLFVAFVKTQPKERYEIKNFIITEDLNHSNKINILVTDSLDQMLDNFSGTYNFSVNGFRQTLKFKDGIASSDLEINKSLFLYIKHENESDSVSKLYYVSKKANGINPISISWYVLLVIPAIFILIGYMFRKLIGLVVFLLIAYMYFGYNKGLSFSTLLESVFDGLKALF